MIFSNKNIPRNIHVTISNKEIVNQCIFLGVVIDEKLPWKEHIQRVRNKLCKCLGIMYRAKCKLNLKSLQSLYYVLSLPYINYCLKVWSSSHASKLECLNILQYSTIWLICNKAIKIFIIIIILIIEGQKVCIIEVNLLVKCHV